MFRYKISVCDETEIRMREPESMAPRAFVYVLWRKRDVILSRMRAYHYFAV